MKPRPAWPCPPYSYPIRIKHSNVEYTSISSCATRLQAQCNISSIRHWNGKLILSHNTGAACNHPDPAHRIACSRSPSLNLAVSFGGLASLVEGSEGTQPRKALIVMPTNEHDTDTHEQAKQVLHLLSRDPASPKSDATTGQVVAGHHDDRHLFEPSLWRNWRRWRPLLKP